MSRELRGTGSVFKRAGREQWWYKYSHRGQVVTESSRSTDRRVAVKLLAEALRRLAKNPVVGPKADRLTLNDLIDNLLADLRRRERRSVATAEHFCRNFVAYFGASERAVDIDARAVDAYVEHRRREGRRGRADRELSNATLNRETACLRHAFELAVQDKLLSADHVPRVHRLKEAGARQGFIEPADFAVLHDALPDYLKDPIAFLYHSAWRAGEMRSLEWRDVDGDVIRLRPENSKTNEARTLVLRGELAAIVERARANRRLDCRSVFHDRGQPIGDFRKAWRNACRYANLAGTCDPQTCGADCATWHGRVPHDLRRSGVRNIFRATRSQSTAMKFSGHKTDAMFRRYNIISETDMAEAAEAASAYVATRANEPKTIERLGTSLGTKTGS